MGVDQHGLQITAATQTAIDHYDRAVDEMPHFGAAVVAANDRATVLARTGGVSPRPTPGKLAQPRHRL